MANKEYRIYDKHGVVAHSTDMAEVHQAARRMLGLSGVTIVAHDATEVRAYATADEICRVVGAPPDTRPKSINDRLDELAREVQKEYGVTIEHVVFRWARTMNGSASLIASTVTIEGPH